MLGLCVICGKHPAYCKCTIADRFAIPTHEEEISRLRATIAQQAERIKELAGYKEKYLLLSSQYTRDIDRLTDEDGENILASKLAAANASLASKDSVIDKLLDHCADPECMTCGSAVCPHGEPLHFHHDGCPSCVLDAIEAHKKGEQA